MGEAVASFNARQTRKQLHGATGRSGAGGPRRCGGASTSSLPGPLCYSALYCTMAMVTHPEAEPGDTHEIKIFHLDDLYNFAKMPKFRFPQDQEIKKEEEEMLKTEKLFQTKITTSPSFTEIPKLLQNLLNDFKNSQHESCPSFQDLQLYFWDHPQILARF